MDAEEETKVRKLLGSWGLREEVVDSFIANEMDLFSIEHMDNESMSTLLPAHGIRIKFKKKHEEWVKSLSSRTNETETASKEMPALIHDGTVLAAMDLNGNLTDFPDNFMQGDSGDTIVFATDIPTDIATNTAIDGNATVEVQLPLQESNQNAHQSKDSPPAKKGKQHLLDTILAQKSKGKCALMHYDKNGKFLRDSCRDDLVEAILEHETSGDMDIIVSRTRLKFYAEQIVDRCPTENISIFFESFINPRTKKGGARGKLVWRNYNRRRPFASATSTSKVSSSKSNVTNTINDFVLDKPTEGSLCWLKENRGNHGNWEDVLRHWRSTSAARMNSLVLGPELESDFNQSEDLTISRGNKNKKTTRDIEIQIRDKSVHEYMLKFPAFLENTAYMLFEIDFKFLQPNVDPLALFTEWATLSSFVVEQVRKKVKDFLLDTTLTTGEKNLHVLRNLSKLFPTITISGSRKGKKTWRPSHAEASDAFLLEVPSILSLEEEKEKRRDILKKRRQHMQPFVALVGEVENPQQYLVCVDEFFYEVGSVLQAVDLAFKCFFALDTSYPCEAEQTWLFLQRAVYGFSTDKDGFFSGVIRMTDSYAQFKLEKSSA